MGKTEKLIFNGNIWYVMPRTTGVKHSGCKTVLLNAETGNKSLPKAKTSDKGYHSLGLC